MANLTKRTAPLVARRFAALGDPTRLRLLAAMHEREEPAVGDLVAAVGSSYANVSQHLSLLYREGMVDRRRDGARTLYWIADPTLIRICDQVCDGIRDRLHETSANMQGGDES
jgi:DNA-binding transcriptional ArsR family regulator